MSKIKPLFLELSTRILLLLRFPYFLLHKKFPHFFNRLEAHAPYLDTSRMLTRFNGLANLFFRRLLSSIRFQESELDHIREASQKGLVVYLMRNWGQTEYNYFNRLFLKKGLSLACHNNLISMLHWMPWQEALGVLAKKIRFFFEHHKWLSNRELFDLKEALTQNEAPLFCLNLPRDFEWEMPSDFSLFQQLLSAQAELDKPIQLVPLHFVYDRHPGGEQPNLIDILFGERHNPGWLRKVVFFLRNFRKRAVASIGEPINLKNWLSADAEALASHLHHLFFKETKAITGPKLRHRRRVIEEILTDDGFQEKLTQLSTELKIPMPELEKRANQHLNEIAGDMNSTVFELWEFTLNWIFKNVYDGITLDHEGLSRTKKIIKDHPVVLVPAHRSHMDYIILSYLFLLQGISLPYICAGINLSIWPLGGIFRRSGAFFIRRSFGNDRLYPITLKYYLKTLLAYGCVQEFFIEGTRSRSGKLFPPKLGMLSIYDECLKEKTVEDIYFIPVSIGYERIMEEKSYLDEVKGRKKNAEKTSDLLKIRKFLNRKYGKTYVEFGQPLSLKQHGLPAFAEKIMRSINSIATLFPSPLIAMALLSNPSRSKTLEKTLESAMIFLKLLEKKEIRFADSLKNNPRRSLTEALNKFVKEGLVQEHQDEYEKFYTLDAFNRPRLNYFKNNGIHCWVDFALFFKAYSLAQNHLIESIQNQFHILGKLFELEFLPSSYEDTLNYLQTIGLIEVAKGEVSCKDVNLATELVELLTPFYETYWLTLKTLLKNALPEIEEKVLLAKILQSGETHCLRGFIRHQESLCQFTIKNALHFYINLGLLKKSQKKSIYSPAPQNHALGEEYLNLLEKCLGLSEAPSPQLKIISGGLD
ncbi:MAG: 1-acyl-sn-glycerol-3-phosphate acyltransferase [Deltaproteobacteria bacterium]|nr:1-acyl-sn-glycerol-3-phosphate acyltransferase [Deltaproteobacteria bacterium]